MKNLFVKNLTASNGAIKEKRATRVAQQASMAQEDLVRNLQTEVLNLEDTLDDLEDLSPDNSMSLNAVKGDFKGKEWVDNVQATKIAIANKKLELEIAKGTQKKYFTEEEEQA